MAISDYYNSLDEEAKKEFRHRVMEETGFSYATFYYKMRNGNWTKAEVTVINSIIETITHA